MADVSIGTGNRVTVIAVPKKVNNIKRPRVRVLSVAGPAPVVPAPTTFSWSS